MAIRKSSTLLPSVFQTTKNKKFLNATVDQLISEPKLTRINSFIGREFSPNFTKGDSYVQEIDTDRQNYQLEPAVTYTNIGKKVESVNTYVDTINTIRYNDVTRQSHSDLFSQEYYNYSGFVDMDKLVNYGEYFWLPAGPDRVQVFNSTVDNNKSFDVERTEVADVTSYFIDKSPNANPTITLARGGSYTFNVNQVGYQFWIQSETGTSGTTEYSKNTSTRDILGVENNGTTQGTITFNVPLKDAQNDNLNATLADNVDFATNLTYKTLHNVPLSVITAGGGIDEQTEIANKTVVFVNTTSDSTQWDQGDLYDGAPYDSRAYDLPVTLELDVRYDIYQIQVNTIAGIDTVQLVRVGDWPTGQKVKIKQGDTYGNREFIKDPNGLPKIIEPYTAGLDILYYQDGSNANQFGQINIVDQETVPAINVTNEILGKPNYTSANGVTFTNGLKVEFNEDVTPSTYAGKEYYVEGVEQPGGIVLVSVDDLVTPETYTISASEGFDATSYDVGGYDGTLNSPTKQDYILINRASPDLNAWSRGNRWFHREVIEATATYNDYVVQIDDDSRAKRPIIEFFAGLELFNMGISGVSPVTVVDVTQTDALSNVNGSIGYFADGIELQQDNTVIFSKDLDDDVKLNIYKVDFIDQDADTTTDKIINLIKIGSVTDTQCVMSTLGANNQGKQYWVDGTSLKEAQQKTKLNQDPLFNVQDPDHVSFSDSTKYSSTTFAGNKLFSYKRSTTASPDSVLNFGLTYKNFNTIGDIVFDNNFDSDTFTYTKSTGNVKVIVRSGHAHQFDGAGNRTILNGWTKVIEPSIQYQVVQYTVAEEKYSFEIGASVDSSKVRQPLVVYKNGKFVKPSLYTHLIQSEREYVVFSDECSVDDIITIQFYSKDKAINSYYQVPDNLENNANNDTFDTMTLGQMRNHTVEICQNIRTFVGDAPGKSNLRDLNYKQYPGNILQHSAGLTLPMFLLGDEKTPVIQSINYVKNEYTKFKSQFIDNINKLDVDLSDPESAVDKIITTMTGQKSATFPFYYSDMIGWGDQKSTTTYTIDDSSEVDFEFTTQFDLQTVGNKNVLVYHTKTSDKSKTLLVANKDYVFDTTEAKIKLTTNNLGVSNIGIVVNDIITIVEYSNTDGNFIPPTPTKLGLYPRYIPEIINDDSYVTSKTVIVGHDGSKYIGFGDIRDNVILELEKRIYNNIKSFYSSTLFDVSNVQPGYFRNTQQEFAEISIILRKYFGEWAVRNKVDQDKNDTYDATNSFTWNYNNSVLKTDSSLVPGYWRGIYKWLYDTDTPHTTPWEMLGISEKPSWWDTRYGVAPYTSGNTVLWEDLRDGKIYNDAIGTTFTIDNNRKRTNLLDILPVDEQGQLKSPNEFLVRDASIINTQESWSFGDQSPQETAWRRSSELPYVIQIMGFLLFPAKYGTLMFDTNLFEKNTAFDQILQKNKNYRPKLSDFMFHGHSTSTGIMRHEGYNQFISEFARFNSYSIDDLNSIIQNLELKLVYPMAGFTDKQYLKVVAESVTPSSVSENIFIPDEDLNIFTKKSPPLERVNYSGVQIIRRSNGFELQGYDIENPMFNIIPSSNEGKANQHVIGDKTFFEFEDFTSVIQAIPYGTIVANSQQVFDFLVSYQRYLTSKGFIFDGTTGTGGRNDFINSGLEFGFWDQQSWPVNSVIVISPFHKELKVDRLFTTVDNINNTGNVKDSNGDIINPKFYDISRIDNTTTIEVDTDNTQLYSVQLDPIQYEHVLVFNNITIFNDIIYQPELGNRHQRLKLIGYRSGDWNGTLHAPGFFINDDVINLWSQYEDYKKGDIVSFQGKVYVAKYQIASGSVFDFADWILADRIKTGLLKNLSNKANEFKNFYETDKLNLENSVDQLGKGAIGFNKRSYLEGLGLDDVSQVKFHQGTIKNKGTKTAINKLITADLTNLDQSINFYEEWAFRVGEYGSIDSNQLLELVVPESKANNNPTIIHLHDNGELTDSESLESGHYHVQQKDLYRIPKGYTSNLFPKRTSISNTKKDLTNAGYVRLDDIDFTVLDETGLINLTNEIDNLGTGKKVWIAKDTTQSWNVRRIDETNINVVEVNNSTNGFLIYTTDKNHNLQKNDFVLVKGTPPIGRIIKIDTIISSNQFAVLAQGIQATISNVSLPMLKLTTVRFNQASDISTYTPLTGYTQNELVFVDKDKDNRWQVLRNGRPWTTTGTKPASSTIANGKYGKSIALSPNNTYSIVGSPDATNGIVVPYARTEGEGFSELNSRTEKTIGSSLDGYGSSVGLNNEYAVVGAPETESNKGAVFFYFIEPTGALSRRPTIRPNGLSTNDKFGESVAMSGNGRHLFVGAPGNNIVYAYTQISIEDVFKKTHTITASGLPGHYVLSFTPITIDALDVADENGFVYLPYKDFTLSGNQLTFVGTPSAGLQIVVRQNDYFKEIGSFSGSDTMPGDDFGFSIDSDYEGRNVVVGAPSSSVPNADSTVLANAGEAYVFTQTVQKFTGDGSTKSFTTQDDLKTKIFVEVDGVLNTETENPDVPTDNDGSSAEFYTRSGKTITFKYSPADGSNIVVYTGSFREKQKLDQKQISGQIVTSGEQFGFSVAIDIDGSIVAIGSPGEDEVNENTGSVFIFNEAGKNYGTLTNLATIHSQVLNDSFYVDDRLVTISENGTDPSGLASDINDLDIPGVSASVSGKNFVITSTNTMTNNKLTINPGIGQTYSTLTEMKPFRMVQKINHPKNAYNENFGRSLAFDKFYSNFESSSRNLVIASDRASTLLEVGLDVVTNENADNFGLSTTTFDSNSTRFVDRKTQSGAAYVYELLSANSESLSNPNKFVFGQQLKSTNISNLDEFGASVVYSNGRILVGATKDTTARGTTTLTESGSFYEFLNSKVVSTWSVYRNEQDIVDLDTINRVALYNKKSGEVQVFLDYIDNSKGKISGLANSELDFISAIDPADYNNTSWSYNKANTLWWDTSTAFYLNISQGSSEFKINYANQTLPGSSIDVYEWIESTQLPSEYTGEGTPKFPDDSNFVTANVYDVTNNVTRTLYYYWVQGRTEIPAEAEFRNISADTVTRLIEDPKAQGLPYAVFLTQDTVALYNCKDYFLDEEVVLSINYDRKRNDGVVHSEFELYGEGDTSVEVPNRIYNKLVDSLAGANSIGETVPDPFLSEAEKYGVLIKPLQGLFVNRSNAVKIMTQYCNSIFAKAPFAREKSLTNLLGSEPLPTVNSGEYDEKVDTIEELNFLNTVILSTGHKVLVLSDSTKNDYWAIYTLQSDKTWLLTNIQSYNTEDYWSYTVYYDTGFDSTTIPKYQVTLESDLLTLTDAEENDLAKVTDNDEGNFSFFQFQEDATWKEVIIENGTIQFNDSLFDFDITNNNNESTGFDSSGFDFTAFDKVPTFEIRQIVKALKEDIFTDTYKVNFNELFFRLMEYALNESVYTQDWIFKTSFLSVNHKLRSLDQFNTYKFDNSNFIEDFINEIKPYKTKIREYVTKYDKLTTFEGDTTDFDIHSYYDSDLGYFRKPSGEQPGDSTKQTQGLNKPWSENYGYRLDSINVVTAGSGYITAPTVTISAPQLTGGVQATATARTNGDAIISITVTNKGSGYTQDPTVTITGSGTGCKVSTRLVNQTIRSFDSTIKFDRITYSSDIKDWTANTSYSVNDIVAYQNTVTKTQEVYTVTSAFTSGTTFSTEDTNGIEVMTVKSDEDFDNTADRIAAYYYPTTGMIGDDLELLQFGTGYTGNKVTGPLFSDAPGYDVSNFDTIGFDNFEVDSDGLTVLASTDTNLSGGDFGFTNYTGGEYIVSGYVLPGYVQETSLGIDPESINVDGGGFVDTFNSHAPEELVPGIVYDTLDMEVYTHPSQDYEVDGNGPDTRYVSFTDSTSTKRTFAFGDPAKTSQSYLYFFVYRDSTRITDFTIDHQDKTVSINTPLSSTETLHVYAIGATGENISGEYEFTGDGSTTQFKLGNEHTLSKQILVNVDGVETSVTTAENENRTLVTFSTAPVNNAHIHIIVFDQDTSRNAPFQVKTQTITLDGSSKVYSLTNTVEYAQPFGANVIVELDNLRLRPSNQKYYTGDGSTTQFTIPKTAGETSIVNTADFGVAVISKATGLTNNMTATIDYTIVSGNDFVTLTTAPSNGDRVIVFDNTNADYEISGDGTEITLSGGVSTTGTLRVNTFSNHDPIRQQTKVFKGASANYTLDRTTTNTANFWVSLDGVRLHPGQYNINESDGTKIILGGSTLATVTASSILVISHITENEIVPTVGFKLFYDLLGTTTYTRLAKDNTTFVTQRHRIVGADGRPDTKIFVDDVTKLPFVTRDSDNPGVVFIGGERITYWEVSLEDNFITGLRRGTRGTGIIPTITPGFLVVDGGEDQELPQSNTHTQTWYNVGSGTASDGQGIQQSTTTNAKFLKEKEAQLPNFLKELSDARYMAEGYVEDGYVEILE